MRKRDIEEKNGKIVNIKFEGKNITAFEGETVAEALYANGIDIFSLSARHLRPRGIFCGSGKCGQCKINIDGNSNALACRTYVKEGMNVKRNFPAIGISNLKRLSFFRNFPFLVFILKNFLVRVNTVRNGSQKDEYSTDILIVGGGDAGRAALETIERYGGSAIFVDDGTFACEKAKNVTVIQRTRIFSIEGKVVYGISDKGMVKISTNKIIIATGSYNVDRIFENNDLPGIMLYSAVKKLLHKKISPGKIAVIVGSSGEEEDAAHFLEDNGIRVKGIISDRLYRSEYDLFYFYRIKKAYGYRRLKGLEIGKGKMSKKIECDLVVFTDKTKNVDLVLNVNGRVKYLKERDSFFPVRDKNLSIFKNVYYAGNFSAEESSMEGERAALHAMNLTKKKNEKFVEIVGVENENHLQVSGYYR